MSEPGMEQDVLEPHSRAGEDLWQRVGRLVRRAVVVGLVASLLVHAALAIFAALYTLDRSGPGVAEPPDSGFEFAVMSEEQLRELEESALDVQEPTVPEVPVPEVVQQELLDSPESHELVGALDDLRDFGPAVGGGDIGDGEGIGAGGTGSGGASFFGVEAQGRRFAYIVDVSGSMSYGGKMEALRQALVTSVDGLTANGQFLVVAFSSDAWPLGGRAKWTDATPSSQRWARRLIMAMEPSGGTQPTPAFVEVFALRPRPDAIYFMTDGEFPDQVATEIASLNREHEIPIHCITLVNPNAASLMREIARQSGGSYTHVPGP